ncbi:hypothetical protein GALMADRAFT_233204 [Galerina marginata CBS 339.88]|uniref:Uncharacterized protein n=1 Tax=Galerina marginata (strain CBS 339.88) TaxID=685588 RepID=A0A067TNK0_GALM3|nr:hypothetical protein GALMADRAFT_233204 [Galerina marginata CBS 339.88]
MSEDEFDDIPDEFADVQGVDWGQLLAGPSHASYTQSGLAETGYNQPTTPPQPNNPNSSSSYFSDDEDMDSSFLAELDRVEQRIIQASQGTAHSGLPVGGTHEVAVLPLTSRSHRTSCKWQS